MEYTFTKEEHDQIEAICARYPERMAATLPILWFAQDKFGHVDPEVQRLVAEVVGMPEAHVHGVASFYTQYYKKPMGKYVLDVCTCLSCHISGGYDILHHIENKLGIKAGQTTPDGIFSVQSVECLGACGYAPMMQITNDVFVNHLTPEKCDNVIDSLRAGKMPEFESIKMPQHENEAS